MKKGRIFIISGLLLISAALILTGYNMWDDCRASKSAESVLDMLLLKISDDPVPADGRMRYRYNSDGKLTEDEMEYPDYVLNPNMQMPTVTVNGDKYIGIITIPSENKQLPVFDEWSYANLKSGSCRYAGTVYRNNMVICAHNYTGFFSSLKNLHYGDEIRFIDVDGNEFNYIVSEITLLKPSAVADMTSGDWDLTLFTCTIGGEMRVTVRCRLDKAA